MELAGTRLHRAENLVAFNLLLKIPSKGFLDPEPTVVLATLDAWYELSWLSVKASNHLG